MVDLSLRGENENEMEFKFKYVNEEQFVKVVKKVQRERRLRQDAANLVPTTSKDIHVNVLKTDGYVASEEEEGGTGSCAQSFGDSDRKEYLAFSSDKSRPINASLGQEAKEKRQERVNVLILRLRNVRRNILSGLDELIVHSEVINQKDSYFKDPNEDELVDARVRNCLCLIIKQEYPFVVNMRRLSLYAVRQDMISHLKVLLDCHNIALRILKIFIHGAPHILKQEKSKEKLNGLLERMLALSSLCQLFSEEPINIVCLKDFLMDEVGRKCVSLLGSEKKLVKSVPKCYDNKHQKGWEQLCVHCGVSTVTSNTAQNYEIHIPKKKLKKLADRVFGVKERTKETVKKRKSHHKDLTILTKNSKDKANTLREDNEMAADEGALNNPPKELEQLILGVNILQSSGDTSLRNTINASESNYEITKEVASNSVEDAMDLRAKEELAPLEPLNGIQNHLPGVTEYHNIHSEKYPLLLTHNGENNGVNQNEHSVESLSVNIEQEQLKKTLSHEGEAHIPHNDITKISDTAVRLSDKVLGECIHRVGCEVDIFIEELVQKMFSLEFT